MRYSGGPAESAAYRLPWRLRPSLHSISNGETIGMDLRFADQVHQLLPLIGRLAAFHLPREQKTALMLYWCPRFESGCTSTKQKEMVLGRRNQTPHHGRTRAKSERKGGASTSLFGLWLKLAIAGVRAHMPRLDPCSTILACSY